MSIDNFIDSYLLRYKTAIKIGFHLFSAVLAYACAFFIRFDFSLPSRYMPVFYRTLPLIALARMTGYVYYRTFSASWRFAYLKDLMDSLKAVVLGSALFLALMVFMGRLEDFPRSVFLLEALLSLGFISGTKLLVRYAREYRSSVSAKVKRHILIAGAGKAGVLMLNEIRYNKHLGIHPIGFVDDDPYKQGTTIQGVPVLGRSDDIPEVARKYAVDELIVAIPSSGHKNIVRISEIAGRAQLKTQVMPSIGKLIQNGGLTGQLKDVSYEALLGRRAIKFSRERDRSLLEEEIKGKGVLVTGAGGSIGSELCRQVCQFGPRILVLYERYENSMYELEIELRKEFPGQAVLPVVGDILDPEKLSRVMRENGIELVYHAAAYKHVPLMELEPIEAVRNNVLGTLNAARLSIENGVRKFVLISTDKAVNPSNIMGTTKRVAELTVQALNGDVTAFIAVRFGNVIGSNGSVIPIFKRQIAEGGPITVTHPEITRYFMSIPEAVQLVLTAGTMGSGGEIFLLDMGEPIRIAELAGELIKLSGLEPGKDIDIVFTGLRPGEKLHEELYWQGEGIAPTDNRKITMLRQNGANRSSLLGKIDRLRESAARNDAAGVVRMLKGIVPESTIDAGKFDEAEKVSRRAGFCKEG